MSNHSVRYRVINWKDYNQALIRRGNITLWLTEEVIDSWQSLLQPANQVGLAPTPIWLFNACSSFACSTTCLCEQRKD